MSLNGLDDASVTEAYQGALAEAGGWFLLKYASRDAVDVLTRGTGGAAEARGAVAQYEEKSPLYGFLLYRRRKVIIKYVPEGTSRLLQARVAVHFTAVTEKFTPHDTTISITSADELSDAALISACSLHTAAPSSCSSSGSSRRQKLDEITEAAEEGPGATDNVVTAVRPDTATSSIPTIVEPSAVESKAEEPVPEPAVAAEHPKRISSLAPANTVNTVEELHPLLEQPKIETPTEEANKTGFVPTDYRESLKNYDPLFEHGPDPRMSSQTARPALHDLYAEIYAQYNKPKVKLGPRPSQRPSMDSKRPQTSGDGTHGASRPVSSLPAGLRIANRKTMEPKRPKSRESSAVPSIAFPPPPPVPNVPELLYTPQYNPPKSPASVKSMPYTLSHKAPTATPEKQRLMKALELRKKQMKARKEKEAKDVEKEAGQRPAGTEEITESNDVASMGALSADPGQLERNAATKSEDASATTSHNDGEVSSQQDNSTLDGLKQAITPADSAIEIMGHQPENDDQQSAASACSPTSAQTQGSSCAPSTRPSSISEDEAVAVFNKEEVDQVTETSLETLQNEYEQDSVESTPTVVPDNASSGALSENTEVPQAAEPAQQASSAVDAPTRRNKRESMVFLTPNGKLDSRSTRRSNRESAIFFPASSESSQPEDTLSKREKRESAVFSAPTWQSGLEVKDKRRGPVDPIQIHLSAENSEAEYLSDDSFMEELQSAKFEQAQPISVSKSPITSLFPRKSSVSSAVTIPERSSSQQYTPIQTSPEQLKGRKSSGPWLPHANTDTVVMAKKINVSSGISQRIKALAEKSNRDSTGSVSPLATPDASTSTVAQRKSSFFSDPPNGSPPSRQSVKRFSRASFVNVISPLTSDAKITTQQPPSTDGPTLYNVQQSPKKPESVQVTARIIRDVRTQNPALTMPNQTTPLELHQSQIIIDHQKSTKSPLSPRPNPPKAEPLSPRPPSSSHSKEQSFSALPRSSSESSWRPFGRRASESRPPPRSQSAHSFESADEKREEKKEKKDSRTSKLFKRMSGMSSLSRKNQGTRESLEEEPQSVHLPSLREPPPAVQVGDLNVQFPDTLLWKRRWVEIDGTGNLVLSLSKSNDQSKGITRRFHLSEFRMPYVPDQDRQELPYSVILDFIDGRTLQCACETYVAQVQILQILREAHDAWLAYDQLS